MPITLTPEEIGQLQETAADALKMLDAVKLLLNPEAVESAAEALKQLDAVPLLLNPDAMRWSLPGRLHVLRNTLLSFIAETDLDTKRRFIPRP